MEEDPASSDGSVRKGTAVLAGVGRYERRNAGHSGDQRNILRSRVAIRICPRLYDLVSIQFASRSIPFALHTGCGGNVYHRGQAAVYHNEEALCGVE